MTKWFDSNYHYLVPEIGPETTFALSSTRWVDEFLEAKAAGFITRPVITGPLTFLYLAKPSDDAPTGFSPIERLGDLVAVYAELLGRLADAGAEWVQIDEPVLVADIDADRAQVLANAATVYAGFAALENRPRVLVSAPYNSLDDALPVLTAVRRRRHCDRPRSRRDSHGEDLAERTSLPASSTATTSGALTSTPRSRRRAPSPSSARPSRSARRRRFSTFPTPCRVRSTWARSC